MIDKIPVPSLSKIGSVEVSNKYSYLRRILFMIPFIIYFYKKQNIVFAVTSNAVQLVTAIRSLGGGGGERKGITIAGVDRKHREDHRDLRVREAGLIGVP